MKGQLTDGFLADDQRQRVDESQTVEFKTSLAERNDAIQSMVAFANSQGGKVFFGVKNDGTVVGVDMGKNTSENLSTAIRDQTYPSLPVDSIDEIDYEGKKVILVECPRDVPPIVGVYLYSSNPIPLDKPIDAQNLQAYRRVGKSTLKEDFMRMRRPQITDPKVRVALTDVSNLSGRRLPDWFKGRVWVEEGSATAHDVSIEMDPPLCPSDKYIDDLPYPSRTKMGVIFKFVDNFEFTCQAVDAATEMRLIAKYRDDVGLVWEAYRELAVVEHNLRGQTSMGLASGRFGRRIIELPPKAEGTGRLP